MTCVGYDEQFVRVLEANAHRFVSPTQKNANEDKTTKKVKRLRMPERVEARDVEDGRDESGPVEVTSATRRSTRARVKRVRTS